MAEKTSSVQSVDRVLDILEALSSMPQGMTLSDLAATTGLHVSTTHRLVGALVDRGYARKDRNSGKYRLTLRLFEVSRRVSSVLGMLSVSERSLEELASFSREAVHLVERSGNEVMYLYKFEPFQHVINLSSHVGSHSPMYCTGVGKSILAQLTEREVEEYWATTKIRRFTPTTITDREAMRQELSQIRRRGYAIDDEEHDAGVRCVAAPIFNWEGAAIGAVSISAPPARLTEETIARLAPRLLDTTAEISHLLGHVSR